MKKLYSPGGNRPYAFFVILPSFDITLDIYFFVLIVAMAMLAGYLNRSRQLSRKQRRINALEEEMMQAHAELLDAQRDCCELEARLKDFSNPVIAMNSRLPEKGGLPGSGDREDSRPTGTV